MQGVCFALLRNRLTLISGTLCMTPTLRFQYSGAAAGKGSAQPLSSRQAGVRRPAPEASSKSSQGEGAWSERVITGVAGRARWMPRQIAEERVVNNGRCGRRRVVHIGGRLGTFEESPPANMNNSGSPVLGSFGKINLITIDIRFPI